MLAESKCIWLTCELDWRFIAAPLHSNTHQAGRMHVVAFMRKKGSTHPPFQLQSVKIRMPLSKIWIDNLFPNVTVCLTAEKLHLWWRNKIFAPYASHVALGLLTSISSTKIHTYQWRFQCEKCIVPSTAKTFYTDVVAANYNAKQFQVLYFPVCLWCWFKALSL